MRDRLKLGYVGTHLPNYYAQEHDVFSRSADSLRELGKKLDFELYVGETVVTADDARRASRAADEAGVDFLLVQNSSFAMGDVLPEFVRGRARLGLWGAPEPTHEGPIRLNTFVSLNLNAGILERYLGGLDVPFKWFWGEVGDPWMGARLEVTVRALNALKRLSGARVGWLGGLAPTFNNLSFDERKLEARYGIRVHRHELAEVVDRVRSVGKPDRARASATLADGASRVEVLPEHLETAGALYLAFRDLAAEHGYDALAINCWPQLQSDLGIVPCWANASLNEIDGIPVASEGDVLGALSMLALDEITGDRSMLLDINDVDVGAGALLMWHCGNSPARFADDDGVVLANHPTLGRKGYGAPVGVVGEQRFRRQPITITRLSADGEAVLALEADVIDGPSRGFQGSRGWVANFRLNGEEVPVEDLVNTILVQGLEHHFVVGRGHHAAALSEFAGWAGVRTIERIPYREHLQRADSAGSAPR